MERYVATQFYKADSPESRILRESGIAPSEFVLAADAQATLAALQADNRTYINERHDNMKQIEQLQAGLAERTAELEAAKRERDHAKKMEVVQKEVADNQTWHVQQLRAELERVRADNKALDEWRADVTVSLQRPGGAFFVDVPQHIKDLVKERDDLRTLLLALPKVEGAVVVSNGYVKDSTRCHALFGADEDAALYAALLQHRQGMEG